MGPYLLTVAEVARLMGRDVSTVHAWIRDDRFPVEVLDWCGTRVVRRADLEQFLRCEVDLQAVAS